jgi:hypothetical protein
VKTTVQQREEPAELLLECFCRLHYLKLYLDPSGIMEISRFIMDSESKYVVTTIWKRIRLAFIVLFGKGIECQEVVLDTPEIQKMRDFLNERVTWKRGK